MKSIVEEIKSIPAPEEQELKMADGSFDADVIVIGSGPGGYVAAIRAAQLGQKTICVEKGFLGGTCLNVGCIPSKAMIAAAERFQQVKHADVFGVEISGEVTMNFEKMMARKDKIVQTQRGGVGSLFKKNGIRHVDGFARFVDANTIEVEKDGQKERLRGKNFILAMGSGVVMLPIPGLEGGAAANVWTSDDAVNAPFVPKRILVIGGGAVGCEFSYVFNALGSEVTLVEIMDRLVPLSDADLGTELGKLLNRQGIKVKTGAKTTKCERSGKVWKVSIEKDGATEVVEVDVVLLGVGRKSMTDNMDLEKIGVKLNKRGVQVDGSLKTTVPNIYAIGDVVGDLPGHLQLAHVASAEGIHVVQNIVKGEQKPFDFKVIPNVTYTSPEVASVGLTEAEAVAKGYDVQIGKFNFRPLGKAMATGEQDGFVKVIFERQYGELLGIHMIGAHAGDMIHEGVVALKLEATLDYLIDTIHAHPTMGEAVMEAYHDAAGHAIHK